MSNLAPLTEAEVKKLVDDWYRKLDVHAPMIDVLPFLAETGLVMRFPEATLRSLAEFEGWYQGVIRIFFDEVHTMKELTITLSKDRSRADVKLVVYWEASRWKPPAARSERLMMDAEQTWTVARSATTGRAVITQYAVDELRPREGSVPL